MKAAINDVRTFMQIGGQACPDALGVPDDATVQLRRRLIAEEAGELDKALAENDVVEIADGIADLIYVAIGTALAYGIPLEAVWAEVQRSNMSKFTLCLACSGQGALNGAPAGSTEPDCPECRGYGRLAKGDAMGKIQKPPGWTPPDIAGVLGLEKP